MNQKHAPEDRIPTTWASAGAAALGGVVCIGCAAVAMFAAILIGSDEMLAARPFGMAAFVFVGLGLTLFAVALGNVISRAFR